MYIRQRDEVYLFRSEKSLDGEERWEIPYAYKHGTSKDLPKRVLHSVVLPALTCPHTEIVTFAFQREEEREKERREWERRGEERGEVARENCFEIERIDRNTLEGVRKLMIRLEEREEERREERSLERIDCNTLEGVRKLMIRLEERERDKRRGEKREEKRDLSREMIGIHLEEFAKLII